MVRHGRTRGKSRETKRGRKGNRGQKECHKDVIRSNERKSKMPVSVKGEWKKRWWVGGERGKRERKRKREREREREEKEKKKKGKKGGNWVVVTRECRDSITVRRLVCQLAEA